MSIEQNKPSIKLSQEINPSAGFTIGRMWSTLTPDVGNSPLQLLHLKCLDNLPVFVLTFFSVKALFKHSYFGGNLLYPPLRTEVMKLLSLPSVHCLGGVAIVHPYKYEFLTSAH